MPYQKKLQLIPAFLTNKTTIKISWIIIISGIVNRLIQYIYNRSLWADEAVLALNIVERSYIELTQPLDYDQVAPIGFLWIEKFLVNLLGNNEYVLRLFPLIAGIVSLFIFAIIARRYLKNLGSVIAILLFSSISSIVYYSTEVKQYSTDILIALLLCYLLAPYGRKKITTSQTVITILLVVIFLWLSHPAIFIFAAMGLVELVTVILNKDTNISKRKVIIYASGLLSFCIFYFGFLNQANDNQDLFNSWEDAFPNHPLNIIWYLDAFGQFFYKPLGFEYYKLLGFEINLDVVAIALFLLGCFSYFHKNTIILCTLLFPLLTTFAGAGLHLYPFRTRVVLFLAPFFIIAIAEGINWIATLKLHRVIAIFLACLITLTIAAPVVESSMTFVKPKQKEEIKEVLNYIRQREQPQDILYIYQRGIYQFLYYAEKYGYRPGDYILGVDDLDIYDGKKLSEAEWQRYKKDLDNLRGNSRVWVLFSHLNRNSEYKPIKTYLDTIGTELDRFETKGAFVHLYNLHEPR
ncbi:MAG: glycosyltransferase family 39 protein [Xenococcaceae cyanobacterium MO_234.B1]|nr:glycosyltransferase family 39 protein [Xenococcaceae cyanobacterium MO_234.B1]